MTVDTKQLVLKPLDPMTAETMLRSPALTPSLSCLSSTIPGTFYPVVVRQGASAASTGFTLPGGSAGLFISDAIGQRALGVLGAGQRGLLGNPPFINERQRGYTGYRRFTTRFGHSRWNSGGGSNGWRRRGFAASRGYIEENDDGGEW